MKTLTKKQINVLGGIAIAKQSNGYKSAIECLNTGISRTGKSSYSGGYSNKSVWTTTTFGILLDLGIECEFGNDAPRGGANGEFVRITDKKYLAKLKKAHNQAVTEAQIEANKASEAKAARLAEINSQIAAMPNNEAFETKWHSTELKNLSNLSWSDYRNSLKTQFPNEWAVLKTKFQLKQSI